MSLLHFAVVAIADAMEASTHVQLPLVWVLGIVGSLATVVTMLAKLIWSIVNAQMMALTKQVERLQKRVDTLQRGCGVQSCAWRVPAED